MIYFILEKLQFIQRWENEQKTPILPREADNFQ